MSAERHGLVRLTEDNSDDRVWVKGHWQTVGKKPTADERELSKLDALVKDVIEKIERAGAELTDERHAALARHLDAGH